MAIQAGELSSMSFSLLTTEEIRKISVIELLTPNTFDSLDHPLRHGLYDLSMGPSGHQSEDCLTCKQSVRFCPGHFGRIEFPVPIINPFFKSDIGFLLRYMCKSCNKFVSPRRLKYLLLYQLKLINAGYVTEAQELMSIMSDVDGIQTDEATDILMEEKMFDFIKNKELCLDREVSPTKTSESLRKEFVEYHVKRIGTIKTCPHCKNKMWWIITQQGQHLAPFGKIDTGQDVKTVGVGRGGKKGVPVLAGKSRQMLRDLWENEGEFIEALMPILKHRPDDVKCGTDLFYMNAMLVPPPKTRPMTKADGKLTEHQQSRLFKDIIRNNIVLKNVVKAAREKTYDNLPEEAKTLVVSVKGDNLAQKLHQSWKELQISVDILLSTTKKAPVGMMGLKQLIEKKEGALRKYMMGKRVNFAARSVITPDPNLLVHEIGVPLYFATRLTYPVKANFYNVHELRKMVKNGPNVYPGATFVEGENGALIRLSAGDEHKSKREGVAKLLLKSVQSGGGKIVHRHLMNGDVLLLNRQPTLHRPSIMAHTARILKSEKTFRMHYSNCKSYNADFDGDEMNAHYPQNELARSEAYNLMGVKDNYLVPKDGTPLGGLIQDHVISGVRLTLRGRFFNREDYYQLVYNALSHCKGNIKLLPPAILKPKMLWSGKQIISTVLINIIPKNKPPISLHSKAKIGARSWCSAPRRKWNCGKEFQNEKEMSESDVIIHNGHLLCGVLDKQHYGATPFGLTHCLYELYGGSCSSKFLDSAGKLFTAYLQWNGFTLGIKDILINEKQDRERSQIIDKLKDVGNIAAKNALDLDEVPPDLEERLERAFLEDGVKFRGKLDQEYKKILDSFTNDINSVCLPRGLVTKFPQNNLQLMVTSGAKGSTVNTMQISCLLGQIELEGKRPPLMISGKSLPSFKPYETIPRAGGYVDGRFMTGITPQDFFFHCMAGREGLIDTAVKTARSGYLQRCLIKHLEGVMVCYDGTVRDHDGSIIQYAYGEDGLEVQKSTFLNMNQMDFLCRNKNSIIDDSVVQMLMDTTDLKKIEKHKKRIRAWNDELKDEKWRKSSYNGFALFSAHIRDDVAEKHWLKFSKTTGRCKASRKIIKKWNELDDEAKNAYKSVRPDPLMTKFNRNRDYGVITEKLEALVEEYLASKTTRHSKLEKTVRNIINVKYMSSLCQPGESVGLLAAQSIGEPSTQMTLNTFHFAGRGEMNVTLGIPRLREILMTATKNIKTPYMDIPLKKAKPEKMEKRGNRLKKMFQRVTLADVLETIDVREKLVTSPSMLLTYTMKFTFLPYKSYKKLFNVTPKDILRHVEKPFLVTLCKYIRKLGKKYGDVISESKEERTLTRARAEEEDVDNVDTIDVEEGRKRTESSSSSEDEMDDEDATAARLRRRHNDGQEYDDSEESGDESEEEEDKDISMDKNEEGGDRQVNGSFAEEAPPPVLSVNELLDVAERENFVLSTFPMVKSYKFDVVNQEWCQLVFGIPATLSHIDFSSILREICENAVIYHVPNVKRAFLYKNKEGNLSLKTEGINLIELFTYYKMLDLNRLYSNDIHEIARVYGIEAAGRVVVNELKEVFGVYGITVNPRHLLLIADFMTHQGVFSPYSRTSMAFNPSPFQQMTFESTVQFLKDAIVAGKTENLTSPSSRIMTGKQCVAGTGSFDLINEGVFSLGKKHQAKEIRVCSENGFS